MKILKIDSVNAQEVFLFIKYTEKTNVGVMALR
jgi:hypothetical protein